MFLLWRDEVKGELRWTAHPKNSRRVSSVWLLEPDSGSHVSISAIPPCVREQLSACHTTRTQIRPSLCLHSILAAAAAEISQLWWTPAWFWDCTVIKSVLPWAHLKQRRRGCLTLPFPDTMQCQKAGTDLGGGAADSKQWVRPVHQFFFQDFQKKLVLLILSFPPGVEWAVLLKGENRKCIQGNPTWCSWVLPHHQHPAPCPALLFNHCLPTSLYAVCVDNCC